MKEPGNLSKVCVEKVKILKDEKDGAGGNDTHDQIPFPPPAYRPLDQEGCRIIDGNGQGQDQDINWDEGHIKDTTRQKKKDPPVGLGDQKIENRHQGEEDEK